MHLLESGHPIVILPIFPISVYTSGIPIPLFAVCFRNILSPDTDSEQISVTKEFRQRGLTLVLRRVSPYMFEPEPLSLGACVAIEISAHQSANADVDPIMSEQNLDLGRNDSKTETC